MSAPALPAAVRRTLRQTFGIRNLRDGQQAVIARVLAGEDTLAVMPTGAGKSLCYQLPALHLHGATVVVSPLISLMKDQADKLDEAGVEADQLNSARSAGEQAESMRRIADASADVVFATPERLTDADFIAALKRRGVALLVVDEAHCISQWGHDFRPAFLEIGTAAQALGAPPVLALTATATADVIEDIRQRLGRPAMQVVNTGIYRPNLRLQVAQCVREDEKFDRLRQALAKADGAGIVYTATVKACDEVHERLREAGESVARYHGRMPARERSDSQDRFMRNEVRVMVATNAFGMGIDRADLRFVLHWQMPGSLEAYYQEAGRAGRDGNAADCALLFWQRDRQVQQFFLARRYPDADDLRQVLAALRDAPDGLTLAALDEALPELARNPIAVALSLLREGRLARSDRRRTWHAVAGADGTPPRLEALAAEYADKASRDREALERMVFYARTGFCRWRVLHEWFDEPAPFDDERCGLCDNCLRAAAAAPALADPADEVVVGASPQPRFRAGDSVRVPRFGSGRVRAATDGEVTIAFADGRERSFVADYVEPA